MRRICLFEAPVVLTTFSDERLTQFVVTALERELLETVVLSFEGRATNGYFFRIEPRVWDRIAKIIISTLTVRYVDIEQRDLEIAGCRCPEPPLLYTERSTALEEIVNGSGQLLGRDLGRLVLNVVDSQARRLAS